MSNIEDAMRELGEKWNAEESSPDSDMNAAISSLVGLLAVIRTVIVSTGQLSRELFANPVFMSGLGRTLADETGFPFDSMLGFIMCALAIEEVEGDK